MFADPAPPRGERIAVIGAGPAGLTYASLVAEGNEVTVFEKDQRAGGAFRYAGKAPLFQEVEAERGELRALHRRPGRGLRAQRRHVPLRHRRHPRPGAARAVRPHRDRDRRPLSVRPRPDRRWRCSTAAPAAGRASRGSCPCPSCATGSTTAHAAAPPRRFTRAGAARARPSSSSATPCAAGKSKEAIASAFEAALLNGGRSAPMGRSGRAQRHAELRRATLP